MGRSGPELEERRERGETTSSRRFFFHYYRFEQVCYWPEDGSGRIKLKAEG
jgi:hypothetical protein